MNFIVASLFSIIFMNNNPAPAGYGVGDAVANFTLKNVDGKNVSLDDYKSKEGVIVVFTCNHCPYAKAYED
ncbi:MAG: redoxin domain-containing protein, partial [Chitinophagales bacterium]